MSRTSTSVPRYQTVTPQPPRESIPQWQLHHDIRNIALRYSKRLWASCVVDEHDGHCFMVLIDALPLLTEIEIGLLLLVFSLRLSPVKKYSGFHTPQQNLFIPLNAFLD